jgi:diguanylate cyclase (GGDEF)-like protein/PAS domain S-box-containing protein
MSSFRDAGTADGKRFSLLDVVVNLGFAALYAVAVVAGRATRLDGSPLALVWPAAAVGFLWVALNWQRRDRLFLSVLLISALAWTANSLTGVSWGLGAALGVANGAQALVSAALLHRIQTYAGDQPWRLRRPEDLGALIVASLGGSLAAALIGPVALSVADHVDVLPVAGAWTLRNAVSTFAFAAIALRLADRSLPRLWFPPRHGRCELAVAITATALAHGLVFAQPVHLPLAFLLIPFSVWISRFDTTIAAAHMLLVGVFVVLATMAGRGPFAISSPSTQVLLAQAFVAVAGTVALVLALSRDDRQLLVEDLLQAQKQTDEQATLLRAVFETITDGVAVYDANGLTVLRNPAGTALFAADPTDLTQEQWLSYYELSHPDGRPMSMDEIPTARALAGQTVTNVDVVVRTPAHPQSRTMQMSAHPMPLSPGSTWSGGALLAYQDVTAARAGTAEIARAHDLFSGVLGAATEQSIIGCDHDGRIVLFNHGAERMLGYRADEMIGVGLDLLHDPDELAAPGHDWAPGSAVPVIQAAREGRTTTRQWTYLTKDGTRLQVLLSVSPLHDSQGNSIGSISVATDITEQVLAQARLSASEQRFRVAFDTAPVGMMLVGLTAPQSAQILRVNQTLCDFTGRTEAELLTLTMHDLTHPDDRISCERSFEPFLAGEQQEARLEKRYQHADGSTRWGMLSSTVTDAGQEPELLCLIEDITARKHAEAALTHQALHDGLTGLANRALLRDRLEHALAATARSGQDIGVIYLDLDGFKDINDSAGHSVGDETLQHVAERLVSCVRPGDTVSRLGGDEFVILCPEAGTQANLQIVADRVVAALAEPLILTTGTYHIGASIGLAVSDHRSTAEQLLRDADEAMYGAKRAGKNRIVTHDPSTNARAHRAAQLLPDLHDAIARREFVLHGQPVVDLVSGRVVAVETLLRWNHPRRGLLMPADFLDTAEASPLMSAIGQWVLDDSCRMAATWSEALGPDAPAVHVNISGRQLETGHLTRDVLIALERHRLDGSRLVLELTETHVPSIVDSLRRDLQGLRDKGVRIAIDDIGTGYSSLARLTELEVDILKIDKSFIDGLGKNPGCDAVTRAVLGIGHSLGVSVVAEGVETPYQAQTLLRYGADTAQGFLYSPARPEKALLVLLQSRRVVSEDAT